MSADDWVVLPRRGDPQELEILKASYERVCSERDRMRAARSFFARPLGPAPATAGLSTAAVAAFVNGAHAVWIVCASATVALMIVAGIVYGGKPAYRQLYRKALHRGQAATEKTPWNTRTTGSLVDWYRVMLARELELLGAPEAGNRIRHPWQPVATLQDGIDSERTGLWVVQILWLATLVFLVVAAS